LGQGAGAMKVQKFKFLWSECYEMQQMLLNQISFGLNAGQSATNAS
jgi:hypothetical protein